MATWGLRLIVIGFVSACGDAPRAPVTMREVACSVPAGVRDGVKRALAAGELERAERKLSRARVSCPSDAWLDETASAIRAAFTTDRSADTLAADVESEKDPTEAARKRDRALRAYEHEEHAVAQVMASEAPASDTVQYSPHGAYVRLGGVIVDARSGRVAKHLAPDTETTFAPNDARVALVDGPSLAVIDLATGATVLRASGKHPALTWSDDGRFVAWAGDALGFADIANDRIQALAPGAYDAVQIGRGVIAGVTSDQALVVHRLASGDPVARVPHVGSWALDHARDRIVFFESTSNAPLRELDLATGKTRAISFRAPHYVGMCGEAATWSIVGLDGDALNLFRDCSGVDAGAYDLRTQKVSPSTTADGETIESAIAAWTRVDKTHFEDIADVDFTSVNLTMAPNDLGFAGLDRSGRARVWNKAGKVLWAGPARPEQVLAVASAGRGHVDGSDVLTFSHAGELRRWDARTGALVASHALADCAFPTLAVRDDGEGVVACVSDERVRVFRENATTPVLDRARRDSAELFVLDMRGAFAVFEPEVRKPLEVIALDGSAKVSPRALPVAGRLLALAGDDILVQNGATGELSVWLWPTSSQLASIPVTQPGARYQWHDLVGRGRYLGVQQNSDHIDVWSLAGKAATQTMTLTPSPTSPRALALAGDEGPVMVRGSIELVTWLSPRKTHKTPVSGGAASLDYDDALHLFVVAHPTSTALEDGVSDPAMELFAIAHTKTAATIDRAHGTVTLSGDAKLASDLLACKIGKRSVPFSICVARWVD